MRSTAAGRGRFPPFLTSVGNDRGCRGEVEGREILVRGRTPWVLLWAQNRETPSTPSRRRTRAPISQMGRRETQQLSIGGSPNARSSRWEFRPCFPRSRPHLTIKNEGLSPCSSLGARWMILGKSFNILPLGDTISLAVK